MLKEGATDIYASHAQFQDQMHV